ncbi:DUF3047 domain-containing protein [Caenispirillum salinarum]|uniref:DUF3047 domain-containing protein n=1 Tax=Caenispirillum salinarum TaxID=859058 RepID=UPI00384CA75F
MSRRDLPTLLSLFPLLTTAPALAVTAEPADIMQWQAKSFQGETDYALDAVQGRVAVRATCRDAASGLFLERPIDLRETPVLEWSWRVDETFPADGPAEDTKAGDDYPARLYVVKDGGLLPWRSRAVNYVWASAAPEGADWENAYASQAHMVAVRSGPPPEPGAWVTERRDVAEDFRRFHGSAPEEVDAVAIMTDCDDRDAEARAWYGAIRFLPR